MRIKMGDEQYEFDAEVLTVEEARYIKKYTGMGLKAFGAGMQDGDPDVLVAMLAIAKMRTGVAVQWHEFDKLNLADLDIVEDEADADAAEAAVGAAEVPADPTLPTVPPAERNAEVAPTPA